MYKQLKELTGKKVDYELSKEDYYKTIRFLLERSKGELNKIMADANREDSTTPVSYTHLVGKLEPLASIKNPKVYKTVKESISRFHSVLGVRQKDIKIGQLEAGTGGVHISQNGVSKQVVLNKSVFQWEKHHNPKRC